MAPDAKKFLYQLPAQRLASTTLLTKAPDRDGAIRFDES
jgi:hypothetical protein